MVTPIDQLNMGLLPMQTTRPRGFDSMGASLLGVNVDPVNVSSQLAAAAQPTALGRVRGALGQTLSNPNILRGIAAGLLTGPQRTPVSFGQSLLGGLQAGQQLQQAEEDRQRMLEAEALDKRYRQAQIANLLDTSIDPVKQAELDIKRSEEARKQAKFEAEQLKVIGEKKELEEKEKSALVTGQLATGNVLEAISKANAIIEESPMLATGLGGQIFEQVGGTEARNLQAFLDTVKSNLGFDALKKMRFESPTGGALGQVSDTENKLLQSTVASLDLTQDAETLRSNLEKVKRHYGAVAYGVIDEDGNVRSVETAEDVQKVFSGEYKVAYPEMFNDLASTVITKQQIKKRRNQ